MRITKVGVKPELRAWKGRCNRCKSEATATRAEMTNIQYDPRDGYEFSWEKCPVCEAGPFNGMIFYETKDSVQS